MLYTYGIYPFERGMISVSFKHSLLRMVLLFLTFIHPSASLSSSNLIDKFDNIFQRYLISIELKRGEKLSCSFMVANFISQILPLPIKFTLSLSPS